MQGLRKFWSPLPMNLPQLCDNKGASAGLSVVCPQNFRATLTLKYLHGINSFNNYLQCTMTGPGFVGTLSMTYLVKVTIDVGYSGTP